MHLGTEGIGSAAYDPLPELPASGIHDDTESAGGVDSGHSAVTQLHIGEVDEVDDDEVIQAMRAHIKQEQEGKVNKDSWVKDIFTYLLIPSIKAVLT